jgi:Leucine-rich repeat (LRR) protein
MLLKRDVYRSHERMWLPLLFLALLCLRSICSAKKIDADIIADFIDSVNYRPVVPRVIMDNLCTNNTPLPQITCTSRGNVKSINFTSSPGLNGTIPASLGKLQALEAFLMPNNSLSGTLPSALSQWGSSLQIFQVQDNRLTGTLPPSFASWTSIKYFQVYNNQLNGTLPMEYGFVGEGQRSFATSVQYFQVDNNRITGSLPPPYGNMTSVAAFTCSANRISGTLPTEYRTMTSMDIFDVSDNRLTGSLSPEYALWISISAFIVGRNQLSGTLPWEYKAWSNLSSVLDFQRNQISGTLPWQYGLRPWSIFRMSGQLNLLTGTLPLSYQNFSGMTFFQMFANNLSGTLPAAYALWQKVHQIQFSSNRFNGSIPSSWAFAMNRLGLLDISNNSIAGSLPPRPFSSLNALSFSFNQIEGSIPASYLSSTSLYILDAQNNSNLWGHVSPGLFGGITLCGTDVCVSSSNSSTLVFYFCYPSVFLQQLPLVDASIVMQLGSDTRYRRSLPACPIPPPTASIAHPVETDQPSSEYLVWTSATESAAALLTAVVGAAAMVGVDAADVQMLVSILASPCVCRTATSSSQAPLLILNPFAHLTGPSWSVIGSVLTCVALTGLHALGVAVLLLSQHEQQPSQQRGRRSGVQMHCTTVLLGRWLAESHRRRGTAAMLRFPNLSIIVMLFLLPGVARSTVQIASALDSSPHQVDIAAIVIGFLFCCTGVALVELMVYRHICVELARKRGGGRSAIQFAMYHHVHKLFAPIPRAVAVVALPVGSWEPRRSRISFGCVVSSFHGEWHHTWRILLVTNVFVQILSGIGNACDAVQGLTIGALLIACSVIAATRPHRALLASLFVCCSLSLSICSVVLGMLCRHRQVDSDALNSFGVFASFMLAVFKCYHVGMPLVERWLVQRNSQHEVDASPIGMIECDDDAPAAEDSPGASTTSSVGSAHKRSRLTRPSPPQLPGAPPDTASPAVAVSLLPLSDQLQVLQQLIVLATERVQHTEHLL